jgi:hypothetical protein
MSEALEPPVPPNEGCGKLQLLGAGFGATKQVLSPRPLIRPCHSAECCSKRCVQKIPKNKKCGQAIYQPYHDRRFSESSRTGGGNFAEKGLKVPTFGLHRSP